MAPSVHSPPVIWINWIRGKDWVREKGREREERRDLSNRRGSDERKKDEMTEWMICRFLLKKIPHLSVGLSRNSGLAALWKHSKEKGKESIDRSIRTVMITLDLDLSQTKLFRWMMSSYPVDKQLAIFPNMPTNMIEHEGILFFQIRLFLPTVWSLIKSWEKIEVLKKSLLSPSAVCRTPWGWAVAREKKKSTKKNPRSRSSDLRHSSFILSRFRIHPWITKPILLADTS